MLHNDDVEEIENLKIIIKISKDLDELLIHFSFRVYFSFQWATTSLEH